MHSDLANRSEDSDLQQKDVLRTHVSVMRTRILIFTLMWSRIRHFNLMRIRVWLITLMRILLLIKVMQIYDHWCTNPPGTNLSLHFCKRPGPSKAPFWASLALKFWCGSGSCFCFDAYPDPVFAFDADPDSLHEIAAIEKKIHWILNG